MFVGLNVASSIATTDIPEDPLFCFVGDYTVTQLTVSDLCRLMAAILLKLQSWSGVSAACD